MKRAFAIGLALGVAACASAPAQPTTVSITIAAPAPVLTQAPPREPSEDALVWTVDEKGATTRWIAWAPDGYRQVAETQGAYIAVGAEVWRWATVARTVKTTQCEAFATPPGAGEAVQGFVERIGAWGRDVVVAPAEAEEVNELQQSVAITGSVGPYLFVRESVYVFGCGAHGNVGASQVVWDLAHHTKSDILEPEERSAVDGAERIEAQKQLPAFDEPLKLEDVELRGALPRYSDRGTLHLDYAFTTFACYACSSGDWGSYTTSLDIPAHHVPERAKPYVRPSPVVAAWAADHKETPISGWSALTPEAARALATVVTPAG